MTDTVLLTRRSTGLDREHLHERCRELDLETLVYTTTVTIQLLREAVDEGFSVRDRRVNTMRGLHVAYTELMTRLAPNEFAAALETIYGDEEDDQ